MKPIYKTEKEISAPLNIVGERITVLASLDETGDYEIFIQQGPTGTGAPPHKHEWNETFYVLSGEVEFGCDGVSHLATEGALVHVPTGNVHWFRFAKDGSKMISVTGQKSRAANFFRKVSDRLPDGTVDLEIIGRVGNENGVEFLNGV